MQYLRIKSWNQSGFEEIRRSAPVAQLVNSHAKRMAETAQASAQLGNYRWSGRQRKTRYGAIVFTDDYKARVDHKRNNTLLKAVGS